MLTAGSSPRKCARSTSRAASPLRQIEGIDERHAEPARRHGMALRGLVLVKGDLHARHPRHGRHLPHQLRRRMTIAPAPRPAQHDAEAVAAVAVGVAPDAVAVEADEGLGPARAVEVGPLIGQAQMRLDDGAADGLEVEDAGEALEIASRSRPRRPPPAADRPRREWSSGRTCPRRWRGPSRAATTWARPRPAPRRSTRAGPRAASSRSARRCGGPRSPPANCRMRLPAPRPRKFMIGLENTGNRGGMVPCGPAASPWLSATCSLSNTQRCAGFHSHASGSSVGM